MISRNYIRLCLVLLYKELVFIKTLLGLMLSVYDVVGICQSCILVLQDKRIKEVHSLETSQEHKPS